MSNSATCQFISCLDKIIGQPGLSAEFKHYFYEFGAAPNTWEVEMICLHKRAYLSFVLFSLGRSKTQAILVWLTQETSGLMGLKKWLEIYE